MARIQVRPSPSPFRSRSDLLLAPGIHPAHPRGLRQLNSPRDRRHAQVVRRNGDHPTACSQRSRIPVRSSHDRNRTFAYPSLLAARLSKKVRRGLSRPKRGSSLTTFRRRQGERPPRLSRPCCHSPLGGIRGAALESCPGSSGQGLQARLCPWTRVRYPGRHLAGSRSQRGSSRLQVLSWDFAYCLAMEGSCGCAGNHRRARRELGAESGAGPAWLASEASSRLKPS